ncbi:MAG: hypothetical protein RBG13Loki_2139 [Promethearchaeota archaeon CR_4]|nr:MAG: hypothetical protein RBG13Loki_2139 [Candidatus Lokiarchaeota archaeon CR_4]
MVLLACNLDETAIKAELAWTRFLTRAIGQSSQNGTNLDGEFVIRSLGAFPEWPFDREESKVLCESFHPGAWHDLDERSLQKKVNELTAFHEAFQLRGAGIQT